MSRRDELYRQWSLLWPSIGGSTDPERVFNDLAARYSEPHRAYHNLNHIRDCLSHFRMVRHLVVRPVEVEVALWFHDAVYDPTQADNEEQSARLAEQTLQLSGFVGGRAEFVGDLIRHTTHQAEILLGDAALVCDIDLTILGADAGRFWEYDAAIRLEYEWLPDEAYRRGRAAILERFLGRPHIYHTGYFMNRLEDQARLNLTRALARYRP